ncbi:MAG TPA: GNAT family N-acetyltransferase [Acidimicrobiales bacterium]|nr:GNAT family N-acetyltransferase [Acidimicrobiales bacterium]
MTSEIVFAEATIADAASIAALHADSWRRHYRHSYPESFFGDSLDDDRLAVWTDRLRSSAGTYTLVATLSGDLIGFVHVVIEGDAGWGALVDNLHVRHDCHRRGIASQLMKQAAAFVAAAAPGSGLYLWVLERNVRAQAFYRALGAAFADQRSVDPPALPGALCRRCVWPGLNALI